MSQLRRAVAAPGATVPQKDGPDVHAERHGGLACLG